MIIHFFLIFFISVLEACSIIFVHIGPDIPLYVPIVMEQARLFNRDCAIYLIANQKALSESAHLLAKDCHYVPCEALEMSASHKQFRTESKHDKISFEGFWTFTSERFFYLAELIEQEELVDVFHLENDVMLYRDLSALLPVFQYRYAGKIGATFDNHKRCVPGFMYISSSEPIMKLAQHMASRASTGRNDMEIFMEFKELSKGHYIANLPIVIPEYAKDHPLKNQQGQRAEDPAEFFPYFDEFQSVFDAAAMGQYLGGISPRNGVALPGFINESCFFDPSKFKYIWKKDKEGYDRPFLIYKNVEYPINNLHIHSKDLASFFSRREI